MKHLVLTFFLLAGSTPAWATWSVIALDARTGQVVIASATCVRQEAFPKREPMAARDLMDLQAVIIPGVGVAACQAGADNTHANQMLVYTEMKKGTPPADILALLKKDADIERRQFGILTMPNGGSITATNNRVGFNGSGNGRSSLFYGGQYGPDIYYQVQGNTLLGDQVVYLAALAFTRATGTLADRVMAAMEAADANGGDSRCNCGSNPQSHVPCDNKTAHVAYIAIAEKTDDAGVTHNDGKYRSYISVTDDNIMKGESGNPVRTLRPLRRLGEVRFAPSDGAGTDVVQAEVIDQSSPKARDFIRFRLRSRATTGRAGAIHWQNDVQQAIEYLCDLLMPKPPKPKPVALRIELRDVSPLIWRRIIVPNSWTLATLHHSCNRSWAGRILTRTSSGSGSK